MNDWFDLSGKVVAVTGAGQGLGKSFARALSRAGGEVFLLARSEARLKNTAEGIKRETGGRVHALPVDITDEQSVIHAVSEIAERAGRVDVLVNNAAVGRSAKALQDESLEEWNAILTTNLTGTFLMMKHAGKQMIRQNGGKIINIASMTGLVAVRNPTVGAYDVSKAGVACLTRIMAGAWAEYNITVNAVTPGYYMTDINREYVKTHSCFYEDSLRQIPLGKWGNEDDIGAAAVFLASSAADYMTGANLVIDGGYMVW